MSSRPTVQSPAGPADEATSGGAGSSDAGSSDAGSPGAVHAEPGTGTGTAAAEPGSSGPLTTVRPLAMLRTLLPDIGLPLVGYYGMHALGAGDRTALLTATALAGLRVAWTVVRDRSLNLFATVMLVAFGVGTVLTLVSGDTEFLLLKNSFTTGAIGLVFLSTVLWGRPLTLAAAESFNPARGAEFREQYRTDPRVRRGHRLSSAVWGSGLLLEALVRLPLVQLLPVSVMVGLSEVLMIVTLAGLTTWNVWYVRQARRRRSRALAAERAPAAG